MRNILIASKDNEQVKDGVVVSSAYDFLFEGDNNTYDDEYEDYI